MANGDSLSDRVGSATAVLRRLGPTPAVGIILGTGLGSFADHVRSDEIVPYGDIPGFPVSTALSHEGRWIAGNCEGCPVAVMSGRFHLYEGYPPDVVTFPVRVMQALGAHTLIVSNASGGLNPLYASGDVMILDDHINLMFRNPLIGPNDEAWGARFPDLCAPYDLKLQQAAQAAARRAGFSAHRGVYAALTGPNYETRAEYRMLRGLGADVVGMSTVPEVLVATHGGMRVLALSAVTNLCRPDALASTSGEDVVQAAQVAEPKMTQIVRSILRSWAH